MKRMLSLCAAALCLTLALTPTALAADFEPAVPDAKVCYPTSIVRNDDGTELKKIYDLSPEDDPAGIPRSDFRPPAYGACFYRERQKGYGIRAGAAAAGA